MGGDNGWAAIIVRVAVDILYSVATRVAKYQGFLLAGVGHLICFLATIRKPSFAMMLMEIQQAAQYEYVWNIFRL